MTALGRALFLLPLSLACAVRTPEDVQRDYAKTLAPAKLDTGGAPAGAPLPPRTYRVRAYADDSYRAQVIRWEDRARQQLARASEVTSRRFGVTFQLVDARPWSSQVPPTEPLSSVLMKLEALDPGHDVDLVLGYTSALPVFTATQDQLGLARVLGRHAVLRGMESPEEDRALRASLTDLPESEREQLYLQRRTHKETAVLLHEWGHTLGAPHTPEGLMHDTYSRTESFFSEGSLAVITLGLRQKSPGLDDPEVRAAWAKDMTAWLATDAGKQLDEGARKYLEALVEAGGAELEAVMSRADHDVMMRAIQQDHAAMYAEASETLRPLLARHSKQPRLHAVACQVQIHAGATDDAAWALCRRAAELDPKSPSAALFVADLAERRHDPAAAEALAKARAALEQMKDSPADHWVYLAELHRQRKEVSAVESAVARAGEDRGAAELRDWAQRTRRWVGLVPGAVPPEQEGAYVAEFRQAQLELEQARYGRATQRIAELEKGSGQAVGAITLRCELQVRQGAGGRALETCRRALQRYPESVHAQYLLGVVLSNGRSWKDAAVALARVVELDPSIQDVWPLLWSAYRATGNAAAADALRERYQQQFGKPAPFR
ncbi:MAG TPA: M12 family metallo-peptidase [Myxococcales bacterium]|nr:M12 family metallo-peptidase [Myxococcales bacterium]